MLNEVNEGLEWYKSLSLSQKLGLKEYSRLICGIKWEDFTILFSPRQRIEMIHQKLKMEGFGV
jgi:hypothetical protein